jgi:putative flippase GtrA
MVRLMRTYALGTTISHQFIRFVAVGVLLNAGLYCVYLMLTGMLIGSRIAMTFTYCAGVSIGFVLNRNVTFRYQGKNAGALRRYIISYLIGYAINLGALWVLVDGAGIRHEIVQGGAVLIVPVALFTLQKYWVFSDQVLDCPAVCSGSAR